MKKILILGAGRSAPYLISYLLKHAKDNDWFITVADRNIELANKRIGSNTHGNAIRFDVNDSDMLSSQIKKSNIVVNFLAPQFQYLVALTCVRQGRSMISVSYQNENIRDLSNDAHRKGVIILSEMGLDPGIDIMSASAILQRINEQGGQVISFESYGGGLPAPDSLTNPLKYLISWNPRNVVMAGEHGAQYLEEHKIKIIPYHNLFRHSWPIEIEGLGLMEAYPNRDSLMYQQYGFDKSKTVIRGTLRYPGWSETWHQIMRLGLPNESLHIPDLKNRTYAELTEMFLPLNISGADLEQRTSNFLNISRTGKIMENMRWLGLFSDEKINVDAHTSAEVLTHLLAEKLKLTTKERDMVVLHHEIIAEFPDNKKQKIISTMIHYGKKRGFTSMAQSVGMPAGIATKLILQGKLPLTGCHIPTHPAIFTPALKELEKGGFKFNEKIIDLEE
jgi:saccharopine dehydrogenase-like NADP-dependent oxidoreductase